jgi:hypothetical protein
MQAACEKEKIICAWSKIAALTMVRVLDTQYVLLQKHHAVSHI